MFRRVDATRGSAFTQLLLGDELNVDLPDELMELFEASGFCPSDGIKGHPSTGTGWSTIEVEYDDGGHNDYPEGRMYLHYHHESVDGDSKVTKATRAFATPSPSDARFMKAFVDWMQSMTQARQAQ